MATGQRRRAQDPLWYKDAVLYETHVRSFYDSNDDGIGDLRGLVQKLDYLQDLGVTCLWLLPLYPVAAAGRRLRHRRLHGHPPGLRHARRLPRASSRGAHARGIRVIVELVVNHTSDQHPWFQRARRAPPGSPERALLRLERHRRALQGRADHLHRHREVELDLGPGGEAVLLAPLLQPPARPQLRQPGGAARRCSTCCAFWLGARRRRLPARRGPVPRRARTGRAARTSPRRTTYPEAAPRGSWTSASRAGCCSPRRTSGRRTCVTTSATATSATWRSTSRSCRGSSWRCGSRTRFPIIEILRQTPPHPGARASGRCSCATTTS